MFAIKDTLARSQSLRSDCTFTWQTTSSSLRRKDIWNAGIHTILHTPRSVEIGFPQSHTFTFFNNTIHPLLLIWQTQDGWKLKEVSTQPQVGFKSGTDYVAKPFSLISRFFIIIQNIFKFDCENLWPFN